MPVRREPDKWKRFVDLLPDPERRVGLVPILEAFGRAGIDLDQFYSAISNGMKARDTEAGAHEVLNERRSQAFVRKLRRVDAKLNKVEQDYASLEDGLTDPRKKAFAVLNAHTSGPWDLVHQLLRQAKEALQTQILGRTGRPRGEQPHMYARQTDEELHGSRGDSLNAAS